MYQDAEHPRHEDAKRVVKAYGGFLACVLFGFLIGYTTFPHH